MKKTILNFYSNYICSLIENNNNSLTPSFFSPIFNLQLFLTINYYI